MMDRRRALREALRILAPGVPNHETEAIVDHALLSRGLATATPEAAAWLSMIAFIRHTFTDYDALLEDGYDKESARYFVFNSINDVLEGWGSKRRVDPQASVRERET